VIGLLVIKLLQPPLVHSALYWYYPLAFLGHYPVLCPLYLLIKPIVDITIGVVIIMLVLPGPGVIIHTLY